MRREKDWEWTTKAKDATTYSFDGAILSVLMDLRDELKAINTKLSVLQCPNFIAIPHTLKRISRNTAKKRKPRAVGKPKLRVVSR